MSETKPPVNDDVIGRLAEKGEQAMQRLADLPGGNSHTHSCILNCTYAYGSNGQIVDLRDPAKPKILKQKWGDGKPVNNGHDVEEIAPGMVLTATQPIMLLDVHDPLKPKLLAMGRNEDGRFIHTPRWPQNGTDKFLLMAGEIYTTFTFLGGSGWSYGRGAPAFYILCYGMVAYSFSYFLLPIIISAVNGIVRSIQDTRPPVERPPVERPPVARRPSSRVTVKAARSIASL